VRRSARSARVEAGDAGIATWVEEALAEDPETRPASDLRADYGDAVARDREHLVAIRELLAGLSPETDPKLRLLVELLDPSDAPTSRGVGSPMVPIG